MKIIYINNKINFIFYFRNIHDIFEVFRPIVFLQIIVTSSTTILSWSITVIVLFYFFFVYLIYILIVRLMQICIFQNYYNGVSLLDPVNLKSILTPFLFLIHLNLIIYLYDKINEKVGKKIIL